MKKTFTQIFRNAPVLHASKRGEKTILDPQARDYTLNYTSMPLFTKAELEGRGTRKQPYTYPTATSASPYVYIISFWYILARRGATCFIEVNGWLFRITARSIVADDGTKTVLN